MLPAGLPVNVWTRRKTRSRIKDNSRCVTPCTHRWLTVSGRERSDFSAPIQPYKPPSDPHHRAVMALSGASNPSGIDLAGCPFAGSR